MIFEKMDTYIMGFVKMVKQQNLKLNNKNIQGEMYCLSLLSNSLFL